jgi:soluble lytic murein transglycosylase-like protein
MWLVILLLHLFAFGYVVSGQSWSQYTETLTPAITTRLPQPAQSVTFAHPSVHSSQPAPHAGSWDGCLVNEARHAGIHPSLLRALVQVESGGTPYAFGWYDESGVRRQYRTTRYADALVHFDTLQAQGLRFDVGLAQVNSHNLPVLEARLGIAPTQALNPCDNLKLSGYILREKIRQHGLTWNAIARYNGVGAQTHLYAQKVRAVYCRRATWDRLCRQVTPVHQLLRSPLPVHPI